MSFAQIILELGNQFRIETTEPNDSHPFVFVQVYYQDLVIGSAKIITDRVDVECITQVNLDSEWSIFVLENGKTLAATFIKFLIKYPNLVRKPEFRFITAVPEHLKETVANYHFDNGGNTNATTELMLRTELKIPNSFKECDSIIFVQSEIDDNWPDWSLLLGLLQADAYWQQHLDMERLHLLVKNSVCIIAKEGEKLVGFARVLSDYQELASIWDVVVAKDYENRGIATQMMRHLFTNKKLQPVTQWLLFSDTLAARHIYDKFGFEPAQNLPKRTLVQKLRLQTEPPSYLLPLIDEIRVRSKANTLVNGVLELDELQSRAFLFEKKRADLPQFWRKQIAFVDDRTYRNSDTYALVILLLSMLLVDTYAFRNIAYPYFSGQLDNSTTHQAADAMIPNVINITILFLSLLFSTNMTGSQLVGELSKLHKHSISWEAKRLEIVDLFRNCLIISALVAPLCMLSQYYSEDLLTDVMAQDDRVAKDASQFLRPNTVIVLPVFLWMCASQILNSFQYTYLIPAGPINFGIAIFLAEGLSVGKFGMPKMGENGIVVAYVTEASLTALVYYLPLFFSPVFRDLKFWQLCYTSPAFWPRLKNQLYSSSAITATIVFETGLGWHLSALSTKLGLKSQAAYALAFESLLILNHDCWSCRRCDYCRKP